MQQALDALELLARYENPATKVQVRKPRNGGPIVTMYPHKVATEAAAPLRERLAQPEQEFTPHEEGDDGWSDWVCPDPKSYLMKCCDCGLIHEVDSRVAKYEPRPSEMFEVVNDPNLQVQWRMKRRDDISPKQPRQWQWLTDDEIALICGECAASAHKTDDISYARAIEAKLKEKNT
jgi:hypothetical protein